MVYLVHATKKPQLISPVAHRTTGPIVYIVSEDFPKPTVAVIRNIEQITALQVEWKAIDQSRIFSLRSFGTNTYRAPRLQTTAIPRRFSVTCSTSKSSSGQEDGDIRSQMDCS